MAEPIANLTKNQIDTSKPLTMKISMFWIPFFCLYVFQLKAQEKELRSSFWPKEIVTEKYNITIYQPQNETYDTDKNELTSRAAFSIKAIGSEDLTFGSMWVNSSLDVDRETRMVKFESIEVTEVRFPGDVPESKIENFRVFMEEEIPKWELETSQDELIASLEVVEDGVADKLEMSPPAIVFSKEPAVLLFFDGEPKLKELDKDYERVINTPMFVVKEKKSGKYYLSGGELWYSADNPLDKWKYEKKVSGKLKKLKKKHFPSEEENTEDVDVPVEDENTIPVIVVATKPTELIMIDGEAKFVPIQNTKLLYVDNTESNLFMNIESQHYYILISGRWFTAKSTSGPWKNIAADKLPEDFANIPEGSEKDVVLASVAGTDAAQDAKYDAYIPQTAAVDRDKTTASVTYDGEPQFEKIEGISLQYAVNTSSMVLKSGDKYYLCDDAIWFVASSPNGPWKVADERPGEVDKIPPSNPTYNVKYVYIYETTPTVVYVGYTPAYYGCYPYGPTVIYGTGYWYSGWYGPYYYPRPVTYGFNFHYNPYYGWSVGFHVGFGSPYGWYGYHGYCGPYYYRPPVHYHPPGGYYGHGARVDHHNYNNNFNRNAYNNRPGTHPSTRPSTRPSQPATRPSQQPSTRPSTRPSQPQTNPNIKNDMYSDRQGNVHKRTDNGWQQQQKNNYWSQSNYRNLNSQMDRSYQNQQRGAQRTQNYNTQRAASGSYSRPSGGARAGGGGRRR